jgi:coproporphyrinogen III oxidase-like Fe-S oxidoreductase
VEPRSPATAALQYLQPGALNLAALPPLSLYIHWPWCVRKCPYCDFNSHESNGPIPEAGIPGRAARRPRTVAAADLGPQDPHGLHRRRHAQPDVGRGLDRLLSDVRTLLPLEINAEITMEANPGTFEAEKFKAYRASGINRLSIGIQSFNGRHLQALGRIHDENEAMRAVEIAHANFDNFNLDLMYALPGRRWPKRGATSTRRWRSRRRTCRCTT